MSLFNIEEKITLNTWDDIIHRPRYESSTEPRQYLYGHVLTVYSIDDPEVLCSVSDCRKPHAQGFLVSTTGQKEANLCETCATRFMDVRYDEQKAKIQAQARTREQMLRLNKVLIQADSIKERVKELKLAPGGANFLYESLANLRKTSPIALMSALKELAANPEDNIVLTCLADADQEQREQVEQLQGLGIFAADIREELVDKILKPLKELAALTGKTDEYRSLSHYCRWADNLENQFARVEELMKEGQAFFDSRNLDRLKCIPLLEPGSRRVR